MRAFDFSPGRDRRDGELQFFQSAHDRALLAADRRCSPPSTYSRHGDRAPWLQIRGSIVDLCGRGRDRSHAATKRALDLHRVQAGGRMVALVRKDLCARLIAWDRKRLRTFQTYL